MVAVISGNGLGLLGTSASALGSGGQAGLGQSGAAQYVNVATGNLIVTSQDEQLVGQGLLARIVRTYNSLGSAGDIGGGAWLLGLDRRVGNLTGTLGTADSTVTRTGGDGEEEHFTYDAVRGLYVGATGAGAQDTLAWDATAQAWTYTDGATHLQETYDAAGTLRTLQDPTTGTTFTLTYDPTTQQLTDVLDGQDEGLHIGYDEGRVATLSTWEIPLGGGEAQEVGRVTYHYDALNRLTDVITDLTPSNTADAQTFTTHYAYDGDSLRLASLSQGDGVTVAYTYAQDGQGAWRVASVTLGTGAAAQRQDFTYDLAARTTTVTDASGRAWTYGYDAQGRLTAVTSPAVNGQRQVTTYDYTADGHLASVTDALGQTTIYRYDAHGNQVLQRDADGRTVTATYSATDRLLTRTVYQVADPQGTDTADAGVPDAPATTRYVYDDHDRLRYTIDPSGDVQGREYEDGRLVRERTYPTAAYDVSALALDKVPELGLMDSWAGKNISQSTLTEYRYDVAGRLAGRTIYDAVDADGAGVADAATSLTSYVYDAQGLLRQQITWRGADRTVPESVSYGYDGLGRLASRTDAVDGSTTIYSYDDAQGTLRVTQANGHVHTEVRDSAGHLVAVTESATDAGPRTTQYFYDAEGQLRAVQDAGGACSYTFYDAAGQVAGTVDATGAVVAYQRDGDGRIVATTAYATRIDTTGWMADGTAALPADLATVLPSISDRDRTSYRAYDAAGQLMATLDAEGYVVTYAYDGAGQAVSSTAYAHALGAADWTALAAAPDLATLRGRLAQLASDLDRTSYTFRDAAGRVVATLDAAGYVSTIAYDQAGRVVRTRAFATALSAEKRELLGDEPKLSVMLGAVVSSDDDAVARTWYDAAGRAVAALDADGYLSVTTYDEGQNTTYTTRYVAPLKPDQRSALSDHETAATLVGLLVSQAGQTETRQYDADRRLKQSTAVDGAVTTYTYDTMSGQLTGTVTTPAEPDGQVRNTSTQVDGLGDITQSTDSNHVTTTYQYNALGQRVLATDAEGNSVWYFYDAAGRLAYSVRGIADASGTLNALGEVTQRVYDAFGEVTGSTTFAARLDLAALGPDAQTPLSALEAAVAAIADAQHDAHTAVVYDHRGEAVLATDGDGYDAASTYDAFGDLVSRQQQLSQPDQGLDAGNSTTTRYTYDARGQVTQTIEDVGGLDRVTQASHDAYGRLQSTTDARGQVVTYTYEHDDKGRRVTLARQTVQGAIRTTETVYDAFDRVVQQIDAMGAVTQYGYPDAHTTVITTPDGVTLTTVRNAYGDITTVTDALNNSTAYTYTLDAVGNGRLVTTTDALDHASTDHYNAVGELDRHTDASGRVVSYTYDAAGRVLTRTVDPDGLAQTTTYAYDGRGQQVKVTDATGAITSYTYDADGHTLSMVQDVDVGDAHAKTSTTTWTWNGIGEQLSVTAGAGTADARTTAYVYDHLGRRTQTIVDPQGLALTTSYTYDGNDNLVAVTDPKGYVTRYVYDDANERVYTITPSYDPTVSSTALGAVVQAFYDANGRVTATRIYATPISLKDLPTAPSPDDVAARVVQANPGDQRRYTVYDASGQVHYTIDPLGYITEITYDADGRVAETIAYAHPVSNQAFSNAGMWDKLVAGTAEGDMAALISAAGNSETTAEASLNLYGADGRLSYVVRQDQVAGQRVAIVIGRTYDAAGRVLTESAYGNTLPLAGGTLADQLTSENVSGLLVGAPSHVTRYVYDAAGRQRYTIDAGNCVTEQEYDANGRVTTASVYLKPIALPPTLDETQVAAAVVTANDASTTRTTSTQYDHAGRIREVTDGAGTQAYTYDTTGLKESYTDRYQGTWNYTYDAAGRLETETSPQTAVATFTTGNTLTTSNVRLVTRYAYDANGNVISRTEADSTAAARTITYTYDSQNHQVRTTYPDAGYVDTSGVFHAASAIGTTSVVVTYDALGHAIVNKDVRGKYQYKTYDARGEVTFEVEDAGVDETHTALYVTAYTYDAYGNQTGVTRYATPLDISKIEGWSKGSPLSETQVQKGLVTTTADRALRTTFDLRNNKLQVQQSAITYVLGMGPGHGNAATGQPTTTYTYDAYGNQTSTSVLLQGAYGTAGQSNFSDAVWATTYNYYDDRNQKVKSIDPMGYESRWVYDGAGEVTTYVEYANPIDTSNLSADVAPGVPALGGGASGYDRWTTYGYDAIGRKTSESLKGGFNFVNGTAGLVSSSTLTTYGYDDQHHLTSVTVNGATTSTKYDALGRVLAVTGPVRKVLVADWQTQLKNDANLTVASESLYVDAAPTTTYSYDALGNVVRTSRSGTGVATQSTYAHYDALGRVVIAVDAMKAETYSTYDSAGNTTKTWYALTINGSTTGSVVTTTSTYDNAGQRLTTVTTRDGHRDSAVYVKYNAFGEVTARGDGIKNSYSSDGYEAIFQYNDAGQLTSAPASGTGAIHSYGYDLAGHLTFDGSDVSAGAGRTWTHYVLDLDGRAIWARPPSGTAAANVDAGVQTTCTYDRWGNVLTSTDARGAQTTYLYDSQNHLIVETEPDVLVVSASGSRSFQTPTYHWYYDINGLLAQEKDENGNVQTYAYDAAGERTGSRNALLALTVTGYDVFGRAVALKTPRVNKTPSEASNAGDLVHLSYTTYDANDQIVEQGDFTLDDSGMTRTKHVTEKYVLDEGGNRRQVIDALGYTSYYAYDSQGRVLQSQTPVQSDKGKAAVYTYDVNGNKTGETTADGNHQSWAYDYFGRTRTHTDLHGDTYTYTYDADSGLLTKQTSTWDPRDQGQSNPNYLPTTSLGSSSATTYEYYANGSVKKVTQTANGVSKGTTTYTYDGDGNVTDTVTVTSDGAGAGVTIETATEYDSHNRISVVTQKDSTSGAGLERTVYLYDAVGNRRAVLVRSSFGTGASAALTTSGGPTATAIGSKSVPPAQAMNLDVSGNFTDRLGFGLTFTAKQSSGAALPSWLDVHADGTFTGTPKAAGSLTIVVTATDVLGNAVSVQFTLTVSNSAPVFSSVVPDKTATWHKAITAFQVPAATDANGDSISYTASGMPPGIAFNASTRTFSGTPTSAGTYTITYKATDSHGAAVAKTFKMTVGYPPPVYAGGIPTSVDLSDRLIGPFINTSRYVVPDSTFTSPSGATLTYSATTSTGAPLPSDCLYFSSSSKTFTGKFNTRGGWSVNVILKVTDSHGLTATHAFTITGEAAGAATRPMMMVTDTSTDVPVETQPLEDPDTQAVTTQDDGAAIADTTNVSMDEALATPMMLPPDDPDDPRTGGGGTGGGTGGGSGTGGTTTPAAPHIESYWFTYDAVDRVIISNGALTGSKVVLTKDPTSYQLGYDAAGNVIKRTTLNDAGHVMTQASYYDERSELVRADYSVDVTAGGASRGIEELRSYDKAGHLTSIDQFYATGTVVGESHLPYYKRDPDLDEEGAYDGTPVEHKLASATIYHYDHSGHLEQQQNFGHAATWDGSGAQSSAPATLPGENATSWGGMSLQNQVTYKTETGAIGSGYDAVGNVTDYQYYDATTGRTDFYHVNYIRKDGYLEQSTTSRSSDTDYQPAKDTSYYDNFGNRVAIIQHVQMASGTLADTGRAFAYDANGQILRRSDGTVSGGAYIPQGGAGMTHYAYAAGQQVANYDEGGGIHVLEGLTAFSNSETGTSGYVTQLGDSLKSIAQAQYGNASLWYVIAQANGLSSDEDLVPGQSLTIPQVTTSSNDATTFKPYNASEVSGSTTPPSVYAPPPPPPSSHHCSALAMVVVIAVVVVATIVTAGAAAAAMGATGGLFATGGAVLTGTAVAGVSVAEGIAAAAIGGFVGSVAGQLVGDELGVHQGFSFGEALGAGLGAGLTAGLGGLATGGQSLSTLEKANTLAADARIAGFGAASAVGSYAGERLAGQEAHFSWANVAAAAVSTEATSALNLPGTLDQKLGLSSSGFGANLVGGLVGGAITSETTRLLGGHGANSGQIVRDAFGNALGNAAVHGIQVTQRSTGEQEPLGGEVAGSSPSQTFDKAWPASGADTSGWPADVLASYDPSDYPMLASSDLYSTYAGVYGPGSTGGTQPITMPGYTSYLEMNPDGSPYLLNGRTVTDLAPVTVSATAGGDVPSLEVQVDDLVLSRAQAITLDTEQVEEGTGATSDGLEPLSKPETRDGTRPLGKRGQTFNARYKDANGQRPYIRNPLSHPSSDEFFQGDASVKVYGWDSGRHLTSVPIIDRSGLPENLSLLTLQSDYGAWAGYEVQGNGLMKVGASVDTTSRLTWAEWKPSSSLGALDVSVTSSVSASADAKLQFDPKDGSIEADLGGGAIGSLAEVSGSYKSPELTTQWGSLQFNLGGAFDIVAGGGSYKIGISRINGVYRFTAGAGAAAFLGVKGNVDVSAKPNFEQIKTTFTPSIPAQDLTWQRVLPGWWYRR